MSIGAERMPMKVKDEVKRRKATKVSWKLNILVYQDSDGFRSSLMLPLSLRLYESMYAD